MVLEDCDMFIGPERDHTLEGSSRASIIVQALNNYSGIAVLTMKDGGQLHVFQSMYILSFFD